MKTYLRTCVVPLYAPEKIQPHEVVTRSFATSSTTLITNIRMIHSISIVAPEENKISLNYVYLIVFCMASVYEFLPASHPVFKSDKTIAVCQCCKLLDFQRHGSMLPGIRDWSLLYLSSYCSFVIDEFGQCYSRPTCCLIKRGWHSSDYLLPLFEITEVVTCGR